MLYYYNNVKLRYVDKLDLVKKINLLKRLKIFN